MDAVSSISLVILVLILLKLTWDVYILQKIVELQQITLDIHELSIGLLAESINITLPTTTTVNNTTPTPTTTK